MASLKMSAEGFQILERARRQKGWDKAAEVLCSDALTSKATLRRFWAKQPIQYDTFTVSYTHLTLPTIYSV